MVSRTRSVGHSQKYCPNNIWSHPSNIFFLEKCTNMGPFSKFSFISTWRVLRVLMQDALNDISNQVTGTDAVPKEFLVPHRGSVGPLGFGLGSSQNPISRSSSLQTSGWSTQQPIPKILQLLTLHSGFTSSSSS